MTIGIFGGTFNPIHNGHLRIALDIFEDFGLHQLRFIPLANAVHREQPAADGDIRLAMIEAAIGSQHCFMADAREIHRGGPSYTVDTLASLHEDFPDSPLCLLLGSDAFNQFMQWHQPERILQLANLIVMQRPNYRLPDEQSLQALVHTHKVDSIAKWRQQGSGAILFHPVTQLDISASDIRRRIAQYRSARYLTPDPVIELIESNHLYQQNAE